MKVAGPTSVTALFALLAGCGPRLSYVQTGPAYPPKPYGAPIEVVLTQQPRCPYTEIGLIRSESAYLERAMEALREKAREVGADAVIVTGTAAGTTGHTTTTVNRSANTVQTMTSSSRTDILEAVAVSWRCPAGA
jgi:hypothetical protein